MARQLGRQAAEKISLETLITHMIDALLAGEASMCYTSLKKYCGA